MRCLAKAKHRIAHQSIADKFALVVLILRLSLPLWNLLEYNVLLRSKTFCLEKFGEDSVAYLFELDYFTGQ